MAQAGAASRRAPGAGSASRRSSAPRRPDAHARPGDAAVGVVLDLVLARAQQDEVAAQQPGQEVDRLTDLVGVVAAGGLAGEPDHRLHALGHRAEVGDRRADREQHRLDVVLELGQLAVGQLAREVVVHHRLAVDRVARVRDARDPAVLARDPDDRVHEPRDVLAALLQRGAHGVDDERPVVGVGLQHRAQRLVALVVEGRVERAHGDRRAAALGRELVRAEHLGGEVLGRDALCGQPPHVGSGERAGVLSRAFLDDAQQPIPVFDDPVSVSSARLTRLTLAQPLLERLELVTDGNGSSSPKRARWACV